MPVIEHLYRMLAWTWGGYRFRSGEAGYNINSGPLPEIEVFVTAAVYLRALIHKHVCFVRGCYRPAHPHPEHGHPVCRVHIDEHPRDHQ